MILGRWYFEGEFFFGDYKRNIYGCVYEIRLDIRVCIDKYFSFKERDILKVFLIYGCFVI